MSPRTIAPRDLLATAALGLRTRRLRAALSALGIAIGIASMVAVLGISRSGSAQLLAQLDRLGTNLLTVEPGQSLFGERSELPREARRKVAGLAGVRSATAVTAIQGVTVRRTDYVDPATTSGISVQAADPGLLRTLEGGLASGRFLDRASGRYPAVVLGAVAARRLGVRGPGANLWLGGGWFTVVGILDPLPLAPDLDRSALVGYGIARAAFGTERHASTLYVRTDPARVEETRALLGATANAEHPEEVGVSRPSDALAARAAASRALTALFVGLGAVALLVGGVGIANVMVISVLERRAEIGLRRALGARRGHVTAQFLAEALLLSSLGGLAGTAAGAAVTAGYATWRGWPPVVPPAVLAGALASALVIGAAAGLWPALRAARLAPTEALRSA